MTSTFDLKALSRCMGFYGHPEVPNSCSSCPYVSLCRRVIPKTALTPIIEKLEKVLEAADRRPSPQRGK
jgi:hypothetical protein